MVAPLIQPRERYRPAKRPR